MPQKLEFCKMHALGNDFIIINAINALIDIDNTFINKMSDRHCGIGFDQLLMLKKSDLADFNCLIFNADGSEAEQCGNGIRCVARFIHETGLSKNKSLTIETLAGIVDVVIHDYDKIEVNMGKPRRMPDPDMSCNELRITAISMGNPHAIVRVPAIDRFPVREGGENISTHRSFPNGVNVGFIEIVNRAHVRVRTFERGVGETFACGSNACAAVVAGIMNDWLDHKVTVELFYGNLLIEWQGEDHPVIMTGPASRVFFGIY